MNISQVAQASGLSARMIRHYESIELLPAPTRSESGYRQYSQRDLHNLRFIHSARQLGFSMEQVAQLLALWQDRSRSSSEVKLLAQQHLQELEQKIVDLQAMRDTLAELARSCQGDDRPDCPIINSLATP
ncbi:MAG TPA: Cu(I)-responsive transcriptional regulator [Pseudomonas sabulinigri]|uniref:HTH merR-type domain-containing protein n=1 Tax=marine sediment metagenome TaxID=412755 RepID=A0A0F9X951_9ZZZZ|nr:Cu(I)-responsive transcriptional regulator [Halopseudomonas sabulinigri]HEC50759.1 Cu(I)-responsive transcriptional regulator [Halopseudomonas sabulinigri]|tara:strand:+ start:7329 stop:7718 length:390 start_codon:yes stop_codon:yes gene_type:complete